MGEPHVKARGRSDWFDRQVFEMQLEVWRRPIKKIPDPYRDYRGGKDQPECADIPGGGVEPCGIDTPAQADPTVRDGAEPPPNGLKCGQTPRAKVKPPHMHASVANTTIRMQHNSDYVTLDIRSPDPDMPMCQPRNRITDGSNPAPYCVPGLSWGSWEGSE